MSVRRMMLFTLGAKIKNLIEAFKTRVFAAQGEFEAETCLDAQLTDLNNKGLLDSASFVLTPNGYEENLLFSVIPNTSASDLTVTRATTGTRVNADGLIEQVPYNLIQRSEEFDNAGWTKSNVTITANSTLAPNGTLTADTITNTSTGNNHVTQNATGTTNIFYVASCYFKRENNNIARLSLTDQAIQEITVSFNLSTLTLNAISSAGVGWDSISYGFSSEQNGFIRLWLSARKIGPNSIVAVRVGFITSVVGSFDYLWGAQLVQGTQPRDYFPTTNRFNVPRIDYSNGSCPSILVEPQRTNVVLHSGDLSQSVWNKTNYTLSSATAIQGLTATRITKNATNNGFYQGTGSRNLTNSVGTFAAGTKAFSVLIRKGNTAKVGLLVNQILVGSSIAVSCEFDFSTETFTNVSSGLTATFQKPTTDVYRLILVFNDTGTGSSKSIWIAPINNLNNTVDGGYLDFAYAQWELGANATSYIPTTTATVTRNADVIDNTNMSTLIGQTEGAMYIDFNHQRLNPLADSVIATISSGIINNSLLFAVLMNGDFAVILRTSGTTVIFISIPAASFTFGRKKIAISYKSGNTNLYVNGVKIGSTNTNAFTFPVTINKFNLGSSATGGALPNTTINSAALYKTTLTDAQAIQLTTL